MRPLHIMVIDNEELVVQSIVNMLEIKGYILYPFTNAEEALSALSLKAAQINIVITDINMPGMDGYTLIEKIRNFGFDDLKILVLTGYGSIDGAVRAIKFGADGYFEKDRDPELLLFEIKKVAKQLELQYKMNSLKQQVEKQNIYLFTSKNSRIKEIFEIAEKIADKNVNVLITGESGTGKEILARFIHRHSKRKMKRFVSVNCSAIPDSLFESSMFGYMKGAFTGANTDKPGFFEQADSGTLMLDEIGEMPLQNQAKLLIAIEEMLYYPVGSTKSRVTDCRIISATNKNLKESVDKGDFRSDFFYRINTVSLELIPLRERKEDILDFVNIYINFFSKKYQTNMFSVSKGAEKKLMTHDWPGNIRELKQVIERCILFSDGDIINEEVLRFQDFGKKTIQSLSQCKNLDKPYKDAKYDFDRIYFYNALKRSGFNINGVSGITGMNRTYIYQKVKELDLDFN